MQADMALKGWTSVCPIVAIAPPLPTRQVTWRDLFEARRSTGGVLEVDGYGVSAEREQPYGRLCMNSRSKSGTSLHLS